MAGGTSIEWGGPKLFMRSPNGILFQIDPPLQPKAKNEEAAKAFSLGLLALDRRDLDQAKHYFEMTLTLDPSHSEAVEKLREVERKIEAQKAYKDGNHLYLTGKLSTARNYYQTALQLDPGHPDAAEKLHEVERLLAKGVQDKRPPTRSGWPLSSINILIALITVGVVALLGYAGNQLFGGSTRPTPVAPSQSAMPSQITSTTFTPAPPAPTTPVLPTDQPTLTLAPTTPVLPVETPTHTPVSPSPTHTPTLITPSPTPTRTPTPTDTPTLSLTNAPVLACSWQPAEAEAAITWLITTEATAAVAGDIRMIQNIFTSEGSEVRDATGQAGPWTPAWKRYEAEFNNNDILEARHDTITIQADGNRATAQSDSSGSFKPQAGGPEQVYVNEFPSDLWEFERGTDGCWRISRLTINN
jgi:hypothetical protein